MDGVYYATMARNMAEGSGSFWKIYFTETLHPEFFGQPPLAIFFQSLLFDFLGDSLYVERLYSFVVFIINILLFFKLWKSIVPDKEWVKYWWFPLLLWFTVYSITWAARNNMLENTMMVFVSLSVLFLLKSRTRNKWLYIATSGLCVFFAFMCKGPASLYAFCFPVALFLMDKKSSNTFGLLEGLVMFCSAGLAFWAVFTWCNGADVFFRNYYESQFLKSVQVLKNTESRTYILQRFLVEIAPAVGIVAVLFLTARARKIKYAIKNKRMVFVLIVFALCGILPIMISLRQRTYYINTTFIWVCFSLALLTLPIVISLVNDWKRYKTHFLYVSSFFFLFSAILFVVQVGKYKRDEELIHDVEVISGHLAPGTVLHTSTDLLFNWPNPAYLYRYGHINLTDLPTSGAMEFSTLDTLPGYRRVTSATRSYHVYQKNIKE